MTTKIETYVCDFCPRKKRFASSGGANRHERRCFYNPIRKACATCSHFGFERYDSETGEGGPFCAIGKMNNEPGEQPMRSECDDWKGRP